MDYSQYISRRGALANERSGIDQALLELDRAYIKENGFLVGDKVVYRGKHRGEDPKMIGCVCYVESIVCFDENGVLLTIRPETKSGTRALKGSCLNVPSTALSAFAGNCDHHFVKNGTQRGVQKYLCKKCGSCFTDSDRKIGRPCLFEKPLTGAEKTARSRAKPKP